MNYIGNKCPVCDLPFQADDDIVVCPECGAPFHRHCYEQEGKCLFSHMHHTGEAWAPPTPQPEDHPEHIELTPCPVCGRKNAVDASFCNQCGTALHAAGTNVQQPYANPNHADTGYKSPYQQQGYQNPSTPNSQNQNSFPYGGFPPAGGPSPFYPTTIEPDEPLDDGVTAGDTVKYVQNNSQYFLSVFYQIRQRNRSRFSFSAFLFSGGWLLYRKINKLGAILTSLMALLFILNTTVSAYYTTPLMRTLYEQAGVSTNVYPNYDELLRITEQLYQMDSVSILLFFIPLFATIGQFIIMAYCGFQGNRLYYKHCSSDIRRLRAEYPIQSEYDQKLQEHGGVNVSLALSLLICYSIIIYLPNILG